MNFSKDLAKIHIVKYIGTNYLDVHEKFHVNQPYYWCITQPSPFVLQMCHGIDGGSCMGIAALFEDAKYKCSWLMIYFLEMFGRKKKINRGTN